MGKVKSKYTYKLLLLTLKFIPVVLSLLYIVYAFANYAGIELPIICALSRMSIITWTFMHLASIVFKFCIYYKSFIYYTFIVNLINFLHNCCCVRFIDFNKITLHLAIAGTILFIVLIIYVTNNKKSPSKNTI